MGRDYLLHQCSSSGETPVMAAAKGGHVEALKALAEAGGETGATCSAWGGGGVDSLMMACRCSPHLGLHTWAPTLWVTILAQLLFHGTSVRLCLC